MGNEKVRQPEFILEIAEQVEDCALDGNVQGTHRLVGQQYTRVRSERSSNTNALPLPAGEFMWISVKRPRRELHEIEQLNAARPRLSGREPEMSHPLRDARSDPHSRIE